jgi:hypothetical protein
LLALTACGPNPAPDGGFDATTTDAPDATAPADTRSDVPAEAPPPDAPADLCLGRTIEDVPAVGTLVDGVWHVTGDNAATSDAFEEVLQPLRDECGFRVVY